MAVGCQMQIIAKKHIIAHSCTQETHRLQIIAHRRHSLHCIGGSCMLQGSRQPFKSSRISNLDQTNSLSRFTSYKWFEDICSQDINFCGYWLLESSWAISSSRISSPDFTSPLNMGELMWKLMSWNGGADVL